MKNRKTVTLLAAVAFVVLFCALWMSPVHADVGNSFSGGSSGGSHSSGGSYGGSGGSGSLNGIFFLFGSPTGIVVLVIIVIVMILRARTGNSGGGRTYANPGIQPNQGVHEEEAIASVKADDPAFSADNFKAYASEVWLTLQEAWEDKQWQKVRPFESNALFNVHNRQLQEYIDRKKTNFMEMQNIRELHIARYRKDEEVEVLSVKLDASLLDYVVDDETGRVIEGSKTEYVYRSYQLEFIRKLGVKTIEKEGTSVTNCPNCGAPTQVTSSGQCEYCKSVITKGDYGWVLNKYAPWQ